MSKGANFFQSDLPGYKNLELPGKLIVIEGGDGAGRSTQVRMLQKFLHTLGTPVKESGLRRSTLLASVLAHTKERLSVDPRTISLLYTTDLIQQVEQTVIPALHAGFTVIADRYVYSVLARSVVRGVDRQWLQQICSVVIEPDLTLYLDVPPNLLAGRLLLKQTSFDHWEAGLDIGRKETLYDSFVDYQKRLRIEFDRLRDEHNILSIDGTRTRKVIAEDIAQAARRIFEEDNSSSYRGT